MNSVPRQSMVVYGLSCTCHPEAGTRYVGITTKDARIRYRAHINSAFSTSKPSHKDFWIRKHGRNNIKMSIIDSSDTFEGLKEKEVYWIKKLETRSRGVNSTDGGDGVVGLVMSESAKEKFRARTARQMANKHPRSILSLSDVAHVKEMIWSGVTTAEIADIYGLDYSTIGRIASGKNWKNVPWPIGPRARPRTAERKSSVKRNRVNLTDSKLQEASSRILSGESYRDICEEYGYRASGLRAAVKRYRARL